VKGGGGVRFVCPFARGVLIVAAVMLLIRIPAGASQEKAEILYSRGLVEFHANRFDRALELFREAVVANPHDAYARYYVGVTRGRLGDYEGAVEDLRAALVDNPALNEAALELGAALVELGRYEEALGPLQQAQGDARVTGQASLFLGLAQLRLGRDEEARVNFDRAAAADPELRVSGRYYQGVAAYRAGRLHEAEGHFEAVIADRPGSEMGREAERFLLAVRTNRVQSYDLFGSVGFEYDSNVPLVTQDKNIAAVVGDQADGRATLSAGGRYAPVRTETFTFSLGYDFFQSLHFDLDNFDLQNHRAGAQVAWRLGDFRLGLLGRYDYYLISRHFDSFLQEATAFPWVGYVFSGGRTEVFYRMRYRDFLDHDFDVRDAFNHAPGIRQVIEVVDPDRYVFFGYRYDREDPTRSGQVSTGGGQTVNPNAFAYNGQEADAGVSWAFPADIVGEFSYAYRNERYDNASEQPSNAVIFKERRRDNVHHFTVVAAKDLMQHLRLRLAYFGTINDSNQNEFQYDRHIGSVALEVRF
jgi:Tfp pilus assembly protein PilF